MSVSFILERAVFQLLDECHCLLVFVIIEAVSQVVLVERSQSLQFLMF